MSYTIDQFGFEPIDQIPVEENDWVAMIKAFMNSGTAIIKRDFDGKSASSAGGAIRKAAESLGHENDIEVIVKKGTVYVQRVFPVDGPHVDGDVTK